MNSTVKTVVFWLVIVLSAFLLWQVVKAGSGGQKEKEMTFSQFMGEVETGNVREVTIVGQEVRGKLANPSDTPFRTTAPANYPDMIRMLREKGVNITIRDVSNGSWLLYLAPLILQAEIVGLGLWFFMRPLASRGARSLKASDGLVESKAMKNVLRTEIFEDGVRKAHDELNLDVFNLPIEDNKQSGRIHVGEYYYLIEISRGLIKDLPKRSTV